MNMSESQMHIPDGDEEQPLLPVRRLHNFVYCPRLCYLQWVENLFVENEDTVAGTAAHRRVDKPSTFEDERQAHLSSDLPEGARLRSLHLTSEALRLTGIVDMVEGGPNGGRIVDYKRGSARRAENGDRIAKEYDAIQVAAHALLLAEVGVNISDASIYYASDRRHVLVELTPALFDKTREAISATHALGQSGRMPPPLINDTRCSYCSAYPICLPKESHWWALHRKEKSENKNLQLSLELDDYNRAIEGESIEELTEELTPPRPNRDDGEVLVVQSYGTQIGQRGGEFVVTKQNEILRKLPLHQVRSIYLYGPVQLTAQAAQTCLEESIEVAYFSAAGRYMGALLGLPATGVDARLGQYDLFRKDYCRLKLASECIRAKIHNQRVLLMRNGKADKQTLVRMAYAVDAAESAESLDQLRGIEGGAAATYFAEFSSMLKTDGQIAFDFSKRSRRPPRDPVNAMLSLGYSVLAKELAGICHAVGLDPFFGFFHQPRYGRPALALDVMEEFRPLVVDSVVISLINRSEVDENDFIYNARGVTLSESGRKRFWEAWFRRLDTEVSHPEFSYRMNYRRMMEVQVRQLWRFVRGEAHRYHAFTTR